MKNKKLNKYLHEFAEEADDWFKDSIGVKNYHDVKQYLYNLENIKEIDFKKLINNLRYYKTNKESFNNYSFNFHVEVKDFIKRLSTNKIESTIERGVNLGIHTHALSELISIVFPYHYLIYDKKIIETCKFLEIQKPSISLDNFENEYVFYSKNLKSYSASYNFVIYRKEPNKIELKTKISDLFEFGEFLFWVHSNFIEKKVTNKNNSEKDIKKEPKIDNLSFSYNLLRFLKKYETENIYNKNKEENILDVCIKQIQIKDYQGIKNIQISNIPIDTQWIFLTGENGYGKTSILQAIAIALFGNKDNGQILDKNEEIKYFLEYKKFDDICINTNKNKEEEAFFVQLKNFVTYGTSCLNKNVRPTNDSKTYNLFNSYGELLDIEDKLINWEKDEEQKKYFASAKKILLDLLNPHISDIIISRVGSKTVVKYHEKDAESSEFKDFNELATGFKSIIAMIGDMMIRLSENQPEINDFNELYGIAIIDELDLHLHPKFQREIVLKLTNTFPKVQFIASTHSPIPLLAIPENSILINVDRNKKEGIIANKLNIVFSQLTPNSILTSEIFGFDKITSPNAKN